MKLFSRSSCLAVALVLVSFANFPAHNGRAVTRTSGSHDQSGFTCGGGSCTLAFYIPRPIHAPAA